MEEAIMAIIVFTAIYQIIKVFTDYLLKRRLLITGHADMSGILDAPKSKEENSYPTLKWGLVALFAGIGLLIISLINQNAGNYEWIDDDFRSLSLGIELISVSLGFILYFLISRSKTRQ